MGKGTVTKEIADKNQGHSSSIACKELKITQIVQLNQLFQLLHLVRIYGHGFNELSRMVIRKNVNNDVSKDSPIGVRFREVLLERDLTVSPGLRTRILFINQTKKRRERETHSQVFSAMPICLKSANDRTKMLGYLCSYIHLH